MKKFAVVMMIAALSFIAFNCQKKAQETPAPATDTTAVADTTQKAQ